MSGKRMKRNRKKNKRVRGESEGKLLISKLASPDPKGMSPAEVERLHSH
jgi:hypothetical protein